MDQKFADLSRQYQAKSKRLTTVTQLYDIIKSKYTAEQQGPAADQEVTQTLEHINPVPQPVVRQNGIESRQSFRQPRPASSLERLRAFTANQAHNVPEQLHPQQRSGSSAAGHNLDQSRMLPPERPRVSAIRKAMTFAPSVSY
jgi:hypothetical protein